MSAPNETSFDLALLGDSEMANRIRAHDWAATSLGPIDTWSRRLFGALVTSLNSRFQFVIYWGPDLICLYNDSEIPTLGDWHPAALGRPASVLLSTMWDVVGPQLQSVMAGGPATWAEDEPLLFDRSGAVEEAYFTYSYSPLRTEAGAVEGVLLATHETTRRVIGERHLRTMQTVAERAAAATSTEGVCAASTDALVTSPDVPFAQVYLLDGRGLRLAGASGLHVPRADAGWPLLDVAAGGVPEILDASSSGEGLPRRAIAVPIADVGRRPTGVLVAGIADVRPIDDRQLVFLEFVAGQIGSALTAHHALALASATAEREQIDRDLHDSVQQQWIAAEIKIGLARELVRTDPDYAVSLLDDAAHELDVALTQMRDVVQGIYPALLQAEGLVVALEAVCERAPIDARVGGDGIGRFDEAVESGIYYVCLEALQNAAKHGHRGSTADVHLEQDGDMLRVRVADTGPGFSRDGVNLGAGLKNMRARIEGLGGSFEVASEPGCGTTVSAFVPLRHDGVERA